MPALLLIAAPTMQIVAQTSSDKKAEIEQHSQMVQQYLREQRPDLAIPELQKLVELDPDNADAHANLGVLLFFRNNFKDAIPQLRAALQAKPDLWKIKALLGLSEARMRENDAARADLEAAFPHLSGEKVQLEVGITLIDKYTASGDLEKAATTVSELLAANPTDIPLLYMAYRLYADLMGKTMLTLALTSPDSAEMHQVMARELARHADDTAAIANYREAIRINPRLPELHSELGEILFNSSDDKLKAEAESEFKAALAINPADEKARLMLGTIAEKHGDFNAASTDYSEILKYDPNNGDACTALAKVLVSQNQRDRAQELFERAIQIDPTNYIAHYRLSTLYREAGKPEAAKKEVAEYLKYKQMKDKLEKIFHDMRVMSGRHETEDDAQPK